MKPNRAKWKNLAAAWDAYGHAIRWDDLFDMKVGAHGYVALAWKTEDGEVDYADLASPDRGQTWENAERRARPCLTEDLAPRASRG